MGLGGLGHMGVKIAVALGADVTVLSHSEKKARRRAQDGSPSFVSTGDASVFEKYAGTFDFHQHGFLRRSRSRRYWGCSNSTALSFRSARPKKPMQLHPFPLIMGAGVGLVSDRRHQETQEMLDFCGNIQSRQKSKSSSPISLTSL